MDNITPRLKLLGKIEPGDTVSIASMTLYKRDSLLGKINSAIVRTLYNEGRNSLRENIKILNQDLTFINTNLESDDIDKAISGLECLKRDYYHGDDSLKEAINILIQTLKK